MIKRALIATADRLGAWSITRRLTLGVPRIFMLHRFSLSPRPRTMHKDELVRFIRRVAAECDFVTVRELLVRSDRRTSPRRPKAAITIDDGYEDFYTVALPVLHELRVPATLYTTAGFVDRQCWMWWDALRYLLELHPPGTLELDVAGRRVTAELGDASSRDSAWSEIADLLVQDNHARGQAFRELEARAGQSLPAEPTREYAAMTWAQLKEAAQSGIEIGGHTMSHAFLPTLSAEEMHREIDAAKALVERHIDQPLTTFAYPNGMRYDYTPQVIQQVRNAGFNAAVVAYPAPFDPVRPYEVGRWSTHAESSQLDHILSGASELKLRWDAS